MSETTENEDSEKYLVFSILDRLYSCPSRYIGEIALFDTVYPLPLMPSYVLGIINRYSVPYALFDIGMLLYKTPGKQKKVLVLKDEVDRIAFLIDDVEGIVDVTENTLNSDGTSYNWNGDDVLVLNIQNILKRVSEETAQSD